MRITLIEHFIGFSLILFIIILIFIEILLNHIHISEMSEIVLIASIGGIAILFFLGIEFLIEGLNKYKFIKSHITEDYNDLKNKLTEIEDKLSNVVSLKKEKKLDKIFPIIIVLIIILVVILYFSIGKTEEGHWYPTELSYIIGGVIFFLFIIIYIKEFKSEFHRLLSENLLLQKIIDLKEKSKTKIEK